MDFTFYLGFTLFTFYLKDLPLFNVFEDIARKY